MRKCLVRLLILSVISALVTGPGPPAAATEGAPDEVGLFDPSSGRWHLRYPDGRLSSFYFGVPGDTPLLGDWDCDGVDTVALYRESSGFIYLRNRNDFGIGEQDFFYGIPGDVPIAGDWNGDGCDTLGVFRADRFFLSNTLDTSLADIDFYLGAAGDQPFAGDFNGDGKDTVGVYRASTHWAYYLTDLSGLPSSGGVAMADTALWVTGADAAVVAGDWDGDADDTLGVFRSAASTFRLDNVTGQPAPDATHTFGQSHWLPVAGNIGAPPPLPELALTTVADGFVRPLLVTAPVGDDRLFVVEKGGRVLIVEDGAVLPDPFLNLSALVSGGSEQGLLGMAFHPAYATNQLFYVHYTGTAGDTRVVEYRDGPGGPVMLRTVLAVDQPAANHNGGMLQFGPDGRLYVALGDGGGGGDTYRNGQNPFTPLGAIVALDVDGSRPDHVWAIGLRNPWRFDWDGNLIYIADVGEDAWEEVNVVSRFTRLRNFG
ncbi:MAG: PQQ-dependent sugar dehydrogenase, partial [Acidimicrobiia bacterium]|nr:PQQ-dependent sugar dehydrogenase [Acidimicrobiia bacterium]